PHNHHSTKGFRVKPRHQVYVSRAVLFPQLPNLYFGDRHVLPSRPTQVPTVECPTKPVNSLATRVTRAAARSSNGLVRRLVRRLGVDTLYWQVIRYSVGVSEHSTT